MTTINGVTFNMVNLRPVAVHRNATSEQPGSDTNFITDMGYDGLVLRLEGYETTLATYDSVISEFMKTGEQTLVHRTGWQYSVYSAQLSLDLIEGFADNYFPYDLILLTSTPYRESTTLSCRAKAITANNQEWSAEDMPCNNLLDNWSFEDWSAGTSSAPDGWTFACDDGSVAREDTIIKNGTYSMKMIRVTAGYCYSEYDINNYLDYAGKEVTLGIWCYASEANKLRLLIHDGDTAYSSFHTGDSTYRFITVTKTISATPTQLKLYARIDNDNATGYFDGAVFIIGASIPDNTFIRDIDTDGSVDAVPDIKVTGGKAESIGISQITADASNSAPSSHGQTFTTGSSVKSLTKFSFYTSGTTASTGTLDIKLYDDDAKTTLLYSQIGAAYTGPSDWITVTFDDVIPVLPSTQYYIELDNFSDFFGLYRSNTSVYSGGQLYYDGVGDAVKDQCFKTYYYKLIDSIEIYNVADSTIKCYVANDILETAIHRINVDGTGSINYGDDFTTDKWTYNSYTQDKVSHDTVSDELDIADDGYIYWKCDAKYPITGIPTLTTRVNITAGTPTIQIAADSGGSPDTWYDITTAIVDDVDTIYELDSSSLHLKGSTLFYYRFDCVKAAAATCSIKSFELDINIVTIDAEHPVITTGGSASTIRCDQDSDSGMNCTVALYYRDRSWPA